MKQIMTAIVLVVSFLSIAGLSSCTSKEERCDQVAVAMLNKNFLKSNVYHSKKWQKMCIKYWEYEGNDDWRDCILGAKSRAKMNKCGMMRTVKVYEEKFGK